MSYKFISGSVFILLGFSTNYTYAKQNYSKETLAESIENIAQEQHLSITIDKGVDKKILTRPMVRQCANYQCLAKVIDENKLSIIKNNNHYVIKNTSSVPSLTPEHSNNTVTVVGKVFADNYNDELNTNPDDEVINKSDLAKININRPGDIFNRSTDVIASNNTNATGIQANIRGMQGNNRINTMIDGAQQSASTYRGYPGSRDNTYIDPDLIGGINIKKGSGSGPYSANAIGGAINIRTLNGDDIIKPGHTWGLKIKQSYGNNTSKSHIHTIVNQGELTNVPGEVASNDASLGGTIPSKNQSTSIAFASKIADWGEVTLAHSQRASGNYSAGDQGIDHWTDHSDGAQKHYFKGREVNNTSQDAKDWLVKGRFKLKDNQSLALNFNYYKNKYGMYSQTNGFLGGGYQKQYPLQHTQAQTYSANYAWNSASPLVNIKANIWRSKVVGGEDFLDYLAAVKDSVVTNDRKGLELWNTSNFNLDNTLLAVKYGVTAAAESQVPTSNSTFTINAKSITRSAFTQWEFTPVDGVTVNYGLQKTQVSMRDLGYNSEMSGATAQMMKSQKYHTINHSSGISITPIDELTFFTQYSSGGRAPSLRERYMAGIVTPNPSLRPEHSKSLTYGVKFATDNLLINDDHLDITLSRFENRYHDFILRQQGADFGLGSHNYAFYLNNIPKATLKGVDASIGYDSEHFFASFSMTHYDKTSYCYSWQDQRVASANYSKVIAGCYKAQGDKDYGNFVPPKLVTNATLGIKLIQQKLQVGLSYRTNSKSLYNDPAAGLPWDKSQVLDLFSSYKINDSVELDMTISNLTNQYYMPAMSSLRDRLPAPGRTVRATMTVWF